MRAATNLPVLTRTVILDHIYFSMTNIFVRNSQLKKNYLIQIMTHASFIVMRKSSIDQGKA